MCSGSPVDLYVEIPFISDDDLDFAFELELDMPSTSASTSRSENLSRSEDTAPQTQPIHQTKAAFPAAKLLHGRSPLGLTSPIVADDLTITVARPARVLQLISDERLITQQPLTQISRAGAISDCAQIQWRALKAELPGAATEPPAHKRSNSQRRKRDTEPPLARCLVKDFSMKFYRRRVVELTLGRGLARRFNGSSRPSRHV